MNVKRGRFREQLETVLASVDRFLMEFTIELPPFTIERAFFSENSEEDWYKTAKELLAEDSGSFLKKLVMSRSRCLGNLGRELTDCQLTTMYKKMDSIEHRTGRDSYLEKASTTQFASVRFATYAIRKLKRRGRVAPKEQIDLLQQAYENLNNWVLELRTAFIRHIYTIPEVRLKRETNPNKKKNNTCEAEVNGTECVLKPKEVEVLLALDVDGEVLKVRKTHLEEKSLNNKSWMLKFIQTTSLPDDNNNVRATCYEFIGTLIDDRPVESLVAYGADQE